jgi:hypothetical protein
MLGDIETARRFREAIRNSGLSIYDPIEVGHPDLWIPAPEAEVLLNSELCGVLLDYPLRTRSKVVKSLIAQSLGYPVPRSFIKTRPRFPGQQLDTAVQKADNFQPWNEEIDPARRYAFIRVNASHVVTKVKVASGETIAKLDTTGTLTQKYQASFTPTAAKLEVVESDTPQLKSLIARKPSRYFTQKPSDPPDTDTLLPIEEVARRLAPLVGQHVKYTGKVQERNRGGELHKLVVNALGYTEFADAGSFPDVRHQLLEVKLQTSPTVDLGLVLPSSSSPLDISRIAGRSIRHCDTRYAVFEGRISEDKVRLDSLIVTAGQHFFSRFRQMQGKVLNRKLQIRLPTDFFL